MEVLGLRDRVSVSIVKVNPPGGVAADQPGGRRRVWARNVNFPDADAGAKRESKGKVERARRGRVPAARQDYAKNGASQEPAAKRGSHGRGATRNRRERGRSNAGAGPDTGTGGNEMLARPPKVATP